MARTAKKLALERLNLALKAVDKTSLSKAADLVREAIDALGLLEAQKAEGDIDAEIGVRPLEPYSAVEDSEAWAALAYWEMNRGNVLERRLALAGAAGQGVVTLEQLMDAFAKAKLSTPFLGGYSSFRDFAEVAASLQLPAPVFDEGVVSREEIAQGLIKWSDDWGDTSGQGWDELLTAVGALQLRHPRDLGGVEPIGWTWENLGKRVFSETKPRFTPIAGTFADLPEVHPVYLAPTPRLAQAESVMDKLWHEINVLSLSAKNADWKSFDAAMEIAQAILSRLSESRPVVSREAIEKVVDNWMNEYGDTPINELMSWPIVEAIFKLQLAPSAIAGSGDEELARDFDNLLDDYWYILRNWSEGIKPFGDEAKKREESAKSLHSKRPGGALAKLGAR